MSKEYIKECNWQQIRIPKKDFNSWLNSILKESGQ